MIALSGLQLGKDIEIEFIGLRPGEKLSEEIFLNIERDKLTKHDKIYITQPNNFDPLVLRRQVKELERLANIMDETKIVPKIEEILA
jgi:FlaA1/EpsC-like NDP-sugar epimerase